MEIIRFQVKHFVFLALIESLCNSFESNVLRYFLHLNKTLSLILNCHFLNCVIKDTTEGSNVDNHVSLMISEGDTLIYVIH